MLPSVLSGPQDSQRRLTRTAPPQLGRAAGPVEIQAPA